ncbi:hypothetical protein [Bacillus cereus]|uniref:hypothetical protein n=1 Tax=Bacillus cereus TaxID=1396 RepID=UPI000BFD494E|nr:hypothetical protein [Bacillus cereus]PGR83512.1 hypothetical protein COC63_05870 [Bacillus cereus]
MKVTLTEKGRTVIAKDDNGNEVWYYLVGKALTPTCAEFNGSSYTKEDLRWKRDKRGSISKAFAIWIEEIDKEAYNLFFGLSK